MNDKDNASEKPPGGDVKSQPSVRVPPQLPRLPPASDVLSETTLVSPKGNKFHIVTSKEIDATDTP
jgi:hypothetical protein